MSTTARRRSRYAPDNQIERVARLALEYGVNVVLGADGSVAINGRLDGTTNSAEDLDSELESWKRRRDNKAARGQ